MLLIVSDLHLSDGTCAKSVSPRAFKLFSERIQELAYDASVDEDGVYRPIETIDLVLLGDTFDPLHSSLWLDTAPGSPEYLRPWSDSNDPRFTAMLRQITQAILLENCDGLEILSRLSRREIVKLPPASKGQPDFDSKEQVFPRFRTYYMRGNHDWYYGLPGPQFDAIRAEMIDTIGLSNPVDNFPWKPNELGPLHKLFAEYKVHAQHGDMYDKFNYCAERGRNSSTLGDVFAMEMLNRFPVAVQQQLGGSLPASLFDNLRMLTNVRPALAAPLWINSQIKRYADSRALQDKLKSIWDKLGDELLQIDFVREQDKLFEFDLVNEMQLILNISKRASLNTIDDLITWVCDKWGGGELSFASHALREPALKNNQARYIVYGHTHQQETVSLDYPLNMENQVYFNSGTWHSYYDLALAAKHPDEQKFVPYQTMTYVVFYKPEERGKRNFETWTGIFD
jgi:hypothetical protein